jgi:hypothetical protein
MQNVEQMDIFSCLEEIEQQEAEIQAINTETLEVVEPQSLVRQLALFSCCCFDNGRERVLHNLRLLFGWVQRIRPLLE